MGNAYGNLNTFDEKVEQVNRIDKQINSFKKHLENNIKNEKRVLDIRIQELDNDTKKNSKKIKNEFYKNKKFIDTIASNAQKNNQQIYKEKVQEINESFLEYEREKEQQYNKKIVMLELEKENDIKNEHDKCLSKIVELRKVYNKKNKNINKHKKADIDKSLNNNNKRINDVIVANDKIKIDTSQNSDVKIKELTDATKEKVIFLLKEKSKLIDQLKKISPEEIQEKEVVKQV